jgi:hypothetical protein
VLLLSRNVEPLGQRRYWPIYQAAEEAGLPVGVHAFGFRGNPITPSGWPSYYIEEMVGHSQCQQSALASLVLEGVFERFPKLKMVMIEAGFGWAPSLAWRLDKAWRRLRSEVPHVKRPPSEYIREQVWWTTQPMEIRSGARICSTSSSGSAGTACCSRPIIRTGTTTSRRASCRRASAIPTARRFTWAMPEALRDQLMARHVIAPVNELATGTRKFLEIEGRPIAVFNIKGEYFGLMNRCPHQGAALCEGPVDRARAIERSRRDRIHQAWRDHPLSLARLGVRHPHRPVLLRPSPLPREGLSGPGRARASVVKGPYVAETVTVKVESDYVVVEL